MNRLHTSYSNVVLWSIQQDSNGLRIYCSLRNLFLTLAVWWAALAGFGYLFIKLMDNTSYDIAVVLFCVLIAFVQGIIVVPRYVIDKRKGDYLVVDIGRKCVHLPHLQKEICWDTTPPVFRLDFYKDLSDSFSEFNLQTSDGNVYPILKLLGFGYKFGGMDKKLRALGFEVQEHRHKPSDT